MKEEPRASSTDVVQSKDDRGCGTFMGYSLNLRCFCGQPGVPLCRSCRSKEAVVSVLETMKCDGCGDPVMFLFPGMGTVRCGECEFKSLPPTPENVARVVEDVLVHEDGVRRHDDDAWWRARSGAQAVASAFAQRGWSVVPSA